MGYAGQLITWAKCPICGEEAAYSSTDTFRPCYDCIKNKRFKPLEDKDKELVCI